MLSFLTLRALLLELVPLREHLLVKLLVADRLLLEMKKATVLFWSTATSDSQLQLKNSFQQPNYFKTWSESRGFDSWCRQGFFQLTNSPSKFCCFTVCSMF